MTAKKLLLVATVDYHFKAFHLPFMRQLYEQGWEIHIAAKGDLTLPFVSKQHRLPIERHPLKKANLYAYKQLKSLMEIHQFDIVHCHTPTGGLLGRLATFSMKKKPLLFYTAHGFHFCKGAPLLNWLIYYPIEKTLARKTDCLITINQEDYALATKALKAKEIAFIHGVGVNVAQYQPIDKEIKEKLREKHLIEKEAFLFFYAAEFNRNKNQRLLLQAFKKIAKQHPSSQLLLAGEGPLLSDCQRLATELGIDRQVVFLGFTNEVKEWLQMSDVAVASSLREGLPVNILEAMACGLPIVATMNRGHHELIRDRHNGYLIAATDVHRFAEKMESLILSEQERERFAKANRQLVSKYSTEVVMEELMILYAKYTQEKKDESNHQHYRAYI
ncbi:glycosyltransferase family 4 protein [Cytobacillus sp. FSL K6-0129]|uniref:glycosyltransferase family 4 protein n=1 Tax=Cytobacillus sp. FSL K6-0129 TaxID=2921421 RepID=UPI0030F60227